MTKKTNIKKFSQIKRVKLPALITSGYRFEVAGYKPRTGFTIVELLVAIGLFGVIVSIAMGGFVRALRTQRQIVALITANSNMSLVIEQISREMRTGNSFCASACPIGELNFTNSRGERIFYGIKTITTGRFGYYGAIVRRVGDDGECAQITADSVNVRNLNFKLFGASDALPEGNPYFPPRITIIVSISPSAGQASVVSENITNIQTTVSARML